MTLEKEITYIIVKKYSSFLLENRGEQLYIDNIINDLKKVISLNKKELYNFLITEIDTNSHGKYHICLIIIMRLGLVELLNDLYIIYNKKQKASNDWKNNMVETFLYFNYKPSYNLCKNHIEKLVAQKNIYASTFQLVIKSFDISENSAAKLLTILVSYYYSKNNSFGEYILENIKRNIPEKGLTLFLKELKSKNENCYKSLMEELNIRATINLD